MAAHVATVGGPHVSTAEAQSLYTRGQRTSILASAILGFMLDGFDMLMLSFLYLPLTQHFHTTIAPIAFAFSLQLFFSMLGGVLFGRLADVYGRRTLLALSILVYALGSLGSAFTWSIGSLAVFRSITGLGLGGEWGVGMALYNEAYTSKHRAFGCSLIQGSFLIGILLAALSSGWALRTFGTDTGWRVAFLMGVVPLALVVWIRHSIPESRIWSEYNRLRLSGRLPAAKQRASRIGWELFTPPALKYTVLGLLLVGSYMYAFYAVATVMPTILGKVYQVPLAVGSDITAVVTLVAAGFYFFIGYLGDTWGRKRAFILAQLVWVVGYVLFYLVLARSHQAYHDPFYLWPVFGAYLIWYLGSGSFAVFGTWFSEIYPTEMRSSGISISYMIGRGMSAVVPLLVPLLAARSSLAAGASTGLVAVLVGLGLAAYLRETRGKELEPIEELAG